MEVVLAPFTAGQRIGYRTTRTGLAVIADLDGDGDDDLQYGTVWIENLGPSGFSSERRGVFNTFGRRATVTADLDGDGREEIVLSRDNMDEWILGLDPSVLRVESTVARSPLLRDPAIAAADIDQDGRIDLVSKRGQIAYGRGGGAFDPFVAVTDRAGEVVGIEDYDGDGRPDLLLRFGTALMLQISPRQFVQAGSGSEIDGVALASRVADMDRDGRLDIVNGGFVRFRDDRGFTNRELSAGFGFGLQPLQIGDLDGDGDLDVLASTGWFENLGNRDFSFVRDDFGVPNSGGVLSAIVGDVNGDGLDDLVAIEPNRAGGIQTNYIYILADGSGGFLAPQPAATFARIGGPMQLAELNNDGIPDLIVGGVVSFSGVYPIEVALSDGTTPFASVHSTTVIDSVVDAVDEDGDGFADLRTGSGILWNDGGTGSFTRGPRIPGTSVALFASSYVDLDGDGIDEALMGDQTPVGPSIVAKRGASGDFVVLPGSLPIAAPSTVAVDLDEDGDLDLTNGSEILTNLESQLHVPFLGRVGGSVDLELSWQVGVNPGPVFAFTFASMSTARIAFNPLGMLRLDPGGLLQARTTQIPAVSGEATLQLSVPNDPSLAGLSFPVQAVFLPTSGAPKLSNLAFVDIR